MERIYIKRRRIIIGFVILFALLGAGILVIDYIQPQNGAELPSYSKQGIQIENEAVYSNGTIYFTARCFFEGHGLPKPTGDQYQIQYVYLWLIRYQGYLMEFNTNENGTLEFNRTLGDIQIASETMIKEGDLTLAIDEAVTIRFQTTYSLTSSLSIYVGVIANGSIGLGRWEQNTTIIQV